MRSSDQFGARARSDAEWKKFEVSATYPWEAIESDSALWSLLIAVERTADALEGLKGEWRAIEASLGAEGA